MRVAWTDAALRDLDDIADYLLIHYPAVAPAFKRRLQTVIRRVARWPESARLSANRPGVRVVPLGRYPYKLFYRVTRETVEVLHIHHSARRPWAE
jgi:plasmid stabilization system protein ParE